MKQSERLVAALSGRQAPRLTARRRWRGAWLRGAVVLAFGAHPVTTGDHLFSLGPGALRYAGRYPDSPSTEIPITMHPRQLSLGYTRAIDVTLGAEPGWTSGETATLVAQRLGDGSLMASCRSWDRT